MSRLLVVGVLALALAGCTASPSPAPSPAATTSGTSPAPSPVGPSSGSPVAPEPAASPSAFAITFGFAVPSGPVKVSHPAPVPPLRTLVGVYAGNHPEGSPAYQRMSFYFRGGYPYYQVAYVAAVLRDASGTPVSLPGNAFLQVMFTDAQAHTDAGASTVTATPPSSIGYTNLKGYAPAGDSEGHVTYGLGLQTVPNADQVLQLRLGELTKPDGTGGTYYVVFVDIKTA
jgi:hypothetical protein